MPGACSPGRSALLSPGQLPPCLSSIGAGTQQRPVSSLLSSFGDSWGRQGVAGRRTARTKALSGAEQGKSEGLGKDSLAEGWRGRGDLQGPVMNCFRAHSLSARGSSRKGALFLERETEAQRGVREGELQALCSISLGSEGREDQEPGSAQTPPVTRHGTPVCLPPLPCLCFLWERRFWVVLS